MSDRVEIVNGDSLLVLQLLDDNSVDAIVTDPPYGLSFMGKKWDYDVPSEELWRQCFRVLKAGGHLLCFAGTRTQHRMAVRIEDAGFEIRDMIAWVYGSGFPKSLDVSKAIDKAAGAEREVVGKHANPAGNKAGGNSLNMSAVGMPTEAFITTPATPEAKQWEGWGTALKPALEPITVARKPLIGTVAENVLRHGTGAINVDGCRVGTGTGKTTTYQVSDMRGGNYGQDVERYAEREKLTYTSIDKGRWPANFIHDGSEQVTDLLGSAARFFYCAKASKRDRDEGCEGMEARWKAGYSYTDEKGNAADGMFKDRETIKRNHHPTVKPTDLMRYLCRLVTPPDGTVLDPFMGSGSTGKAAVLEGFRFIGIEREEEYCEIAKARIKHAQREL
jgi:site-specific DNA-methyltransferase (adenine-specific)